ncbi:MAG: hypothetical protein PHO56_04525 [Patescibacteria group bacterium]|nr:hypothetical protein [Patescibacteria group bacterium]
MVNEKTKIWLKINKNQSGWIALKQKGFTKKGRIALFPKHTRQAAAVTIDTHPASPSSAPLPRRGIFTPLKRGFYVPGS